MLVSRARGPSEDAFEGLTYLSGCEQRHQLEELPETHCNSMQFCTFSVVFSRFHMFAASLDAIADRPMGNIALEESLERLRLGLDFRDPLDGLSFPGLCELELGGRWNQSLTGLELPKLESLSLSVHFNQPLELPETLQSLSLGMAFDESLEGTRAEAAVATARSSIQLAALDLRFRLQPSHRFLPAAKEP